MGKSVVPAHQPEAIRYFTRAVLRDLKALEQILAEGHIEQEIRRFGAEQEYFLVDPSWRPAPVGVEVLERLGEPFTTELARFNLEANLAPDVLEGGGLGRLEAGLNRLLDRVRTAAAEAGAEPILVGILPTMVQSDLSLDNITPRERYYALNEALSRRRSDPSQRLRIEGTDELMLEHDSVMLEACNTSFQVHLQVTSEEFPAFYNAAQLVVAPVLAAAVNSPLFFGRRLWAETRIALFQQSVDTRSSTLHMREVLPRVHFGDRWVRGSVVDIFQEDLGRFPVLITAEVDEDPFEVLAAGRAPSLKALQLYNSTIYRWNRPCYGVTDGRPHLRIECRVLPAGPSVVDQVANAAFWLGAVLGTVKRHGNVADGMDFDDVRGNFLTAARIGLKAAFSWGGDGEPVAAPRLILDTLLPLASDGLIDAGLDAAEVDRYLGVVARRVESGQTGAVWAVKALAGLGDRGTRTERLAAVTAATARHQKTGKPVHEWGPAELSEAGGWRRHYRRVEQYMTTRLVTIQADEPIDLVAFLLYRQNLRHVLVEDEDHRLLGIVSYRSILRLVAEAGVTVEVVERAARDIMEADPVTVTPDTSTLEVMRLMREHQLSCLPVVKDGKLVGMVTDREIAPVAYQLLESRLEDES